MAWFDDVYTFKQSSLRLAHITDSHLFADKNGEYFGVNTAQHFAKALAHMAQQQLDGVIFGGDLTQDHTAESYLLFAELIHNSHLNCPIFWLPGNHDEVAMLNRISGGQIHKAKRLMADHAELLLINSKGPTPAGWVTAAHLAEITQCLEQSTHSKVIFCHHNPLPINGYLDKHMLENGPQLLNTLVNNRTVTTLFHGHVHNDYKQRFRSLNVYATPASSVQFVKYSEDWQQQNCGAAYRMLYINSTQQQATATIKTDVVWLNG
jgi:3',5'-cyclic-AMP phosphodiesterase